MAEIAEAAAQGAEITAELNGQELTITAYEPENMEAAFNVTGERRNALVAALKSFVYEPAIYQNAPSSSFAYVIDDSRSARPVLYSARQTRRSWPH